MEKEGNASALTMGGMWSKMRGWRNNKERLGEVSFLDELSL